MLVGEEEGSERGTEDSVEFERSMVRQQGHGVIERVSLLTRSPLFQLCRNTSRRPREGLGVRQSEAS